GNDELRTSQLAEVLSDARRWDGKCPVIIAGDFNLDASEPGVASEFANNAFQEAVAMPRTPTTPPRRLFESGRKIDCAFIRGPMRATNGRVHNQVRASDHYPISFSIVA